MKRKIFCFWILLFMSNSAWDICLGQEFHGSVKSPTYQGGIDTLKEFINRNISYSNNIKPGKEKVVIAVACTVNEEGKPEGTKILRGLNAAVDAEAIRVVNMVKWIPAMQWDKPVKVKVVVPVEFRVEADAKADPIEIKGQVTDRMTGNPIEGALVIVKGTNAGAITDVDGNYSISVQSEESQLEFTSMGYGYKTEPVGSNRMINAELQSEDMVIEFNK